MTVYTFQFIALDSNGEQMPNAVGSFYGSSDTAFVTPIQVTAQDGTLTTTPTANRLGLVTFSYDGDDPRGYWKSGAQSIPVVANEAADTAAAAAVAAQAAAEAAAANTTAPTEATVRTVITSDLANPAADTTVAVANVAATAAAPVADDAIANAVETGGAVLAVTDNQYPNRTTRAKHVPAFALYFAEVSGADPTGATSAVAAINSTLATYGSVYLVGTYLVDGPILCSASDQKITLAPGSTLQVPSSYSGDVFQIGNPTTTVRGVWIGGGGTITEVGKSGGAATTLSSWTAFRFLSASAGAQVNFNTIEGLQVKFCGTVIGYQTAGGAINGNDVVSVRALYFKRLVDIGTPTGGGSYSSNTLAWVGGQCSNFTDYGIKGLTGVNWTLDNVRPWDIGNNPAAISCEILSSATYTRIRGGLVTFQNFTDNGTVASGQTIIEDPYQTRPWLLTQMIRPSECVARTNPQSGINAVPTLTLSSNDWLSWSFPKSNSGIVFVYRLPEGVTNLQVSLVVRDISGSSGDAYWGVGFQSEVNAGGTTGVSTVNVTSTNPASGGVVTIALPLKSTLVGGLTYRITVSRTGSNAADTLATAIGLVGILLKPIK